jgi:hypothetical protein
MWRRRLERFGIEWSASKWWRSNIRADVGSDIGTNVLTNIGRVADTSSICSDHRRDELKRKCARECDRCIYMWLFSASR